MKKKQWKDLERKKTLGARQNDTSDKNIVEGVAQQWLVFIRFIREKLEQGPKFISEDLQEENNVREARKRQHNQLITQNKQMQAWQSQAIQALQ